ncbi:MAG: N-acyl homoserine lactonase family protein [Thermodesulfobacteriota bacterium]
MKKTASETWVEKMYILDGGSIELDKSSMTFGHDAGQKVRVPSPVYLIQTKQGHVLFDTGWWPQAVPLLDGMGLKPAITPSQALPGLLKQAGLEPDQIGKVILSHLHVDHAGGVQFLPKAEFIVQKDEYSYAFHPHAFSQLAYIAPAINFPSYKWTLIDGDQVLMPGLTVVLANGHTPGLQALIVDLPETGVVILSSDCCYLGQNLEEEVIPGIVWDPVRALHSIKKLKTLARLLDGVVIPNHDIGLWESTLRKYPDGYA